MAGITNKIKSMFSSRSDSEKDTPMEVDPQKYEVKVSGIRIGENTICQLEVKAEDNEKDKKLSKKGMDKRIPVLILDCSGSMGQWVQRSVNAWQRALKALNYREDTKVHIIEFESRTTKSSHDMGDLDKLNMRSRGGTSMSGVAQELSTILTKYKDSNINIWLISDGQISDQQRFKESMTSQLAASLGSPNIAVVGVRLCCGHSDPDVQAMSAVGLLSNQNFQLEDYHMNDGRMRGRYEYEDMDNYDDISGLVGILSGIKGTEEA